MADSNPTLSFEGVLVALSVSASFGGCTATLKNSSGVIFECLALDPRMQNLLETAMSKAWYVNVTYLTQDQFNVLTGVTLDISARPTNAAL